MSLIYNGTEITDVVYNGTVLDKVIYNGVTVFEKSQYELKEIGWGVNIIPENIISMGLTINPDAKIVYAFDPIVYQQGTYIHRIDNLYFGARTLSSDIESSYSNAYQISAIPLTGIRIPSGKKFYISCTDEIASDVINRVLFMYGGDKDVTGQDVSSFAVPGDPAGGTIIGGSGYAGAVQPEGVNPFGYTIENSTGTLTTNGNTRLNAMKYICATNNGVFPSSYNGSWESNGWLWFGPRYCVGTEFIKSGLQFNVWFVRSGGGPALPYANNKARTNLNDIYISIGQFNVNATAYGGEYHFIPPRGGKYKITANSSNAKLGYNKIVNDESIDTFFDIPEFEIDLQGGEDFLIICSTINQEDDEYILNISQIA